VTARQAGNANYYAASSVSRSFQIKKVVTKSASATVYFAAMSPALSAEAKATLRRLAAKLPAKATIVRADVVGFVQPVGKTDNDFTLSNSRSNNVATYLKAQGLTFKSVAGKGRAREQGAVARRVEVTFTYTVIE
jgi:outer membrane protein OmpA-like peptidoglycan-associated protein